MTERWNELKKRYWPPKKQQLLILVLTGVLLAVIAIPVEPEKEKAQEGSEEIPEETGEEDYEKRMEQKLEELLSKVEGVGQVRVMLTFRDGGERTVEKDRTVSGDGSREETVYEERGSSERTPYVTSETNPQVEGVLVIAQGGGNGQIRREILEAAQALFGIEAHKIKIMKMEGPK